MDFTPKIIAFCCNWCAYAAADLAGVLRLQYPPGIRIIRVLCSGMVHPEMILNALNQGADGVIILGCHPGECHYRDGNTTALARAEMVSELLEDFGFAAERFQITWVSGAEALEFVQAVTQMSKTIEKLGPNPAGRSAPN